MTKKSLLLGIILSLLSPAMAFAQNAEEQAGKAIGTALLCCWGIAVVVAIVALVFWIMMIVDCVKREESQFPPGQEKNKTLWLIGLIVGLFLPFGIVIPILYFFMIKRKTS